MIRLLFDNPVLMKELRIGMREKRILVILTGYLALLTFVAIVMLAEGLDHASATELPELGRRYFSALFWMQLIGVWLVTPSLTSGSISAERERQSLDMILSSRLTVAEVILGKLGFALGYMVLVLMSTLPLLAVVFFLGGVAPSLFARSYLELMVTALLAGLLGLVFSSREKRTSYANSHAYGTVFLGLFTLMPFYAALREEGSVEYWLWVLFLGSLAYAILFLFVKCLNNIRSQALYLNALSCLFLVYYLAMLATILMNDRWDEGFWYLYYLVHAYLLGVFLNQPGVSTRVEQEKFGKSPFSYPLFWLVLLCAGAALPGIVHSWEAGQVVVSTYLVLALASTGLGARGLFQTMKKRPAFPVIYFSLTTALCLLPFLFLLGDSDPGSGSLALLSPLATLGYVLNEFSSSSPELPITAMVGYSLLAIFGVLKGGHRRTQ